MTVVYMTRVRYGLLVGSFVAAVGATMYAVFLYPRQHIDYYKTQQSKNRAAIKIDDIQPGGMRVWSDPFDRRKHD
ncbi:small integral membrane protein 20-like [Oppia nitens]|uniref:small integral membrane protein 20-like n=1 Tax=Oppia nitens TaxID=1686743 RepID=UPI0023DAB13B|nr:small integral membrane protein 20-like [Oppia nitens]